MAYNLKNSEEVKEYLKNLHVEYKFGCYSEKKGEVCHLLADFNSAVKKDFTKAAILYKHACDDYNYPSSCTKYGDYSLIGKGCTEDIETGYKYVRKGCDLNDPEGCLHAGVLAVSDKVVEKDRATQVANGMRMLQKACHEHALEKACFYLSGIYLRGIENHVDINYKEVHKLSLICCEKGNPYACANLFQMHSKGDGVEKDPELANIYKRRAEVLYEDIKRAPTIVFQEGIDP